MLLTRYLVRDIAILRQYFHKSVLLNKIIPFKLSDIGEGIREVVIKEWFIKPGDVIKQFDPVCEVQSDKASVTISSRYDGHVTRLYGQSEDTILVGQPLIDIEVIADDDGIKSADAKTADTALPVETTSEKSNLTDDINNNKTPKREQELKLNNSQSGDWVNEGKKADNSIKAIPLVRKLAQTLGIDLNNIENPSGVDGRIEMNDVLKLAHLDKKFDSSISIQSENNNNKNNKQVRIEKLTGARKAMIKSMTKSLSIPQFVLTEAISPDYLMQFKCQANTCLENHFLENSLESLENTEKVLKTSEKTENFKEFNPKNVENFQYVGNNTESYQKMTLMPFFIKSLSIALSKFPILNSRFNEENESIEYMPEHNIGVAIDTQNVELGLVVPNVKGVQRLSIGQISRDLARLTRDSRLIGRPKMADLMGGTFTVSNIGSIGGIHAKPLILWPEVAIIAIGKILTIEKNANQMICSGLNSHSHHSLLYVSLSADHRIIDGATAARFLQFWKELLENPGYLLTFLK